MNILQQLEAEQIAKLVAARPVPPFQPGDTVRVSLRVVEGERERIQAFEGVCIARKNAGINSNFTLRKISYGEGVERVFPLHSPRITAIEVVRRGAVRRAKLYYLRGRARQVGAHRRARPRRQPARARWGGRSRGVSGRWPIEIASRVEPGRNDVTRAVIARRTRRSNPADNNSFWSRPHDHPTAHLVRQDLGQPRHRPGRAKAPICSISTFT